jgi:6,7-dimethyl-8-ribityllumazine synthase
MNNLQNNSHLIATDNLQIPISQVVLIYTEWNEPIISELRNGAKKIFENFTQVNITEIKVPGCVEIPYAIKQHYKYIKADAYIALGCVIKGETPHFDYVCDSVTQGISHLNTELDSPIIFGILTVNNEEQAKERLGGKHGHKGEEAAVAALKMIDLKYQIMKS